MELDVNSEYNALGINEAGLEKYYPMLSEPIIKPSQFGFGSREFFYWTNQGVIDIPQNESEGRSWIRLNIYEAIWIRIVQELRIFHTPFKEIVLLKQLLLTDLGEVLFSSFLDTINEMYKQKFDDHKAESIIEGLKELDDSSELKASILKNINTTQLASMLHEILIFDSEIWLFFYYEDSGIQMFVKGLKFDESHQNAVKFSEEYTHIKISLNKLVGEFLTDIRFEKVNKQLGFISENEKILFDALKDNSVSEIHIKKDENNNATFKLTSTTELKDEETILLKKILRMNKYQEVNVISRNGKHFILKNTIKIKTTTP